MPRTARLSAIAAMLVALGLSAVAAGFAQVPSVREITITARGYAFTPSRIEVNQGDILRITLVAADRPHSLAIDEYRICKRASPGRDVTFEFCADRAGTFVYYCSLTDDERCREMRGQLVVKPLTRP